MVQMGCERASAAQAMRATIVQLQKQMEDDSEFAQELLRSEGMAELHRMKAVHKAAEDEKHWRAATWWLEQKAKRRRNRNSSKPVTTKDLQEYLKELIEVIFTSVNCEEDRDRVLMKLAEMAQMAEAEPDETHEEPQDE